MQDLCQSVRQERSLFAVVNGLRLIALIDTYMLKYLITDKPLSEVNSMLNRGTVLVFVLAAGSTLAWSNMASIISGQVPGVEVKVEYDPELLVPEATSRTLHLVVHLKTIDSSFLPDRIQARQEVSLALPDEVIQFSPVQVTASEITTSKGEARADVPMNIVLSPSAQPRDYDFDLSFLSKSNPIGTLQVELPVGARDGSLLEVVPPADVTMFAGAAKSIDLKLLNQYQDYPVKVYGVSISTDSQLVDEVQYKWQPTDKPLLTVEPGRTAHLPLKVTGAFWRSLGNTSANPDLRIHLYYSDGYRAPVESDQEVQVKLSLLYDWWWTLGAALVGGMLGAGFRILVPGISSGPGRSRLIVGVLAAAIGYVMSLAFGLQLIALGGHTLLSSATCFSALGLGVVLSVVPPAKVIQTIESKAFGGAQP
jgi:hypothetical protein